MQVIVGSGVPVKLWLDPKELEEPALQQLRNLADLPFVAKTGIAVMPDCHAGKGSTVGSVIPTDKAVIPSAVGVDIGCGMVATKTDLLFDDVKDLDLRTVRNKIEQAIPLGAGRQHQQGSAGYRQATAVVPSLPELAPEQCPVLQCHGALKPEQFMDKIIGQLGTLGSGNHFIEICLDPEGHVWTLLHSGSRGPGNMIGTYYINIAKSLMRKFMIDLVDPDLAYLPEGIPEFDQYMKAIDWAQAYAKANRELMNERVIEVLSNVTGRPVQTEMTIQCQHNYVQRENHFGQNLWITRKGAISARPNEFGIVPSSMGNPSFIVQGLGNADSYHSSSHGAGRKMSRSEARRQFTLEDLKRQTQNVECGTSESVIDEIPGAYKDINLVMANQADLVRIYTKLQPLVNVKG